MRKKATKSKSKGRAVGNHHSGDFSANDNLEEGGQHSNHSVESYSSFHESSEGGSQSNPGNSNQRNGGGGGDKEQMAAEVRQVQKIASTETNFLQIFKCLGLFISIAAAILVSTGTYIVLANEETVDYVEHFQLFCNTIQDAAQFHAKNMFQAMDMCGQAITSAAIATNATFPYVTVPNFEILGAATRAQSGMEMLLWQPILVNDNEKEEWIEYSLQNQGWVNESRALATKNAEQQQQQEGSIITYSPANYIYNSIPDMIWDRDENLVVRPTVAPPPFIPVWQVSPPPFHPGFVNFNLPTFPGNKEQLDATYTNRAPILAKAIDLSRLGLVAQNPSDHDAYHSLFVDWNKPESNKNGTSSSTSSSSAFNNPHSLFTQPIFEELYNTSSPIVGFVMGVVPWDRYMTNLLPSGISGITCVLENSCGQAFTYQLNGNRAFYVGEGDLHDTRYSDMRVVVPFEEPKGFSNSSSNKDPMNNAGNKTDDEEANDKVGNCHYQFALYPTQEFENTYYTNIPKTMTITVACIFSAMAVTFLLYDFMVYRRNSKILKIAARSGAIVSSLFPSTVRDRLFASKDEEKNSKLGSTNHDKDTPCGDTATSLKEFMSEDGASGRRDSLSMDEVFKKGGGGNNARNGHGSGSSGNNVDGGDDDYILKTKPIADLFPATTIMFCDISGFTLWSASRDPEAVFTLLETLYRSFDAIAKKRRVYKVETIGDCYVAVAGLPEPRANHALVMAQFASEIRKRFIFLIHKKLVPVLGADTGRLSLRVGLHSGPVTAGVLRGENARFQLFGDTMNTASRMESNGKPGLIQVSQETADLLVCGGKPHWVTPREDKIQAKGKGELQTFWLDLQRKNNKGIAYAESNFSSFDGSSDDDGIGNESLPRRSTRTATSTEDNDSHVQLSTSSFLDDSTVNGRESVEDQAMNLPSLLHPDESSHDDDETDLSRSLSQPFRTPAEKQQQKQLQQNQLQQQQQQKQQQQQQRQQQPSHPPNLHDSSNIEYYGYEDHNHDNDHNNNNRDKDDDDSNSNNTNDTEKIIVQEARKLSLKEGGTGSERQIMIRKNSLLAC